MFTIGIYKTRAEAEEAFNRWLDVYTEEQLFIVFAGTHYLLQLRTE